MSNPDTHLNGRQHGVCIRGLQQTKVTRLAANHELTQARFGLQSLDYSIVGLGVAQAWISSNSAGIQVTAANQVGDVLQQYQVLCLHTGPGSDQQPAIATQAAANREF